MHPHLFFEHLKYFKIKGNLLFFVNKVALTCRDMSLLLIEIVFWHIIPGQYTKLLPLSLSSTRGQFLTSAASLARHWRPPFRGATEFRFLSDLPRTISVSRIQLLEQLDQLCQLPQRQSSINSIVACN